MQRTREIPLVAGDERAARRTLRAQVAQLEGRLAALTVDTYPHVVPALPAVPAGAARLLSLGDLERERDRLVARLGAAQRAADEQAAHQARARALLENMLADPPAHKWRRIANHDLGVPGCTVYEVRPRLGPLGLLMDWWRVKVSSGCPLAS